MKRIKTILARRKRRKLRTRAKIFGTALAPRLSVFRSNKHLHAQLIDDERGHTLTSASTQELGKKFGTKAESAFELGKILGDKAKKLGLKQANFDKGAYKYHGRIKALAEGAKKSGLKI